MAAEIFARLTIFLTELGVAILVSYLLWNLSRIYQQDFIRSWFLAFVAFVFYQSMILMQLVFSFHPALRDIFQFFIIVSSYSFASFLVRGMLQTRSGEAHILTDWTARKLLCFICGVAALSVLPFSIVAALESWQQYFQWQFRLLLMGILLLTAAVSLLQRLDKSLGQRLAAVAISLWGLLYVGYAILQLVNAQQMQDIQVALVYKSVELVLLCSVGLALLIWLHEHERTANLQLTEKTRYLNRYDQLTGALNRDAFLVQLQERLQIASEKPLHVLMLGLDKFKTINESVGLKQGDILLRQLNKRFEGSILKPALIARTGGDIFALALNDINSETQLQFALRHLQQLVQKSFELAGEQLQLSCTIGISSAPEDAVSAESLLQKANIAFHQAKRLQSQNLAYRAGMEDETARLISWESELLAAMQKNEFVLYFQPQINLRSNQLDAFEVLVRWQHPQKGFLMPGQFLSFVEQLGFSRQLDFWILQRAIQTISEWRQLGLHVPLAVNMSPLHFQQDGLKQKIQELLMQYKVSPELLELEITENTAMHDMEKGSNHVMELQQMGIRVSIDDFGTGYSSLAYLRRMPIDKIKIDRSFVMDMAGNDSDMMIVKTMIKLAHGLGKRILAEGVETSIQLDLLKSMSCDAVQGYHFSKPLTESDAIIYCKRQLSS
ncbi:putative bifunctional diguanylate cyclase/phosphodiesterase [Rheinheimera baltica]|uniref:putative bifunctional diguanylate cyclase/phosphodiesterase n=1 Tax=Rheinheimera baltica TaxID=67576 RepID=UPI00273E7371|nr:bifunctional diguanylate cyclase/phosphodiesterase [Rheinheimera baltica]MDP5144359.1 bifunctional diguanylate cyclase/phosphodiesterase [Rheinheimera baltica]MDP5189053.1 bifunctional diguanylate cyclase/phosphodiesterase [Rheinheimera baltica]